MSLHEQDDAFTKLVTNSENGVVDFVAYVLIKAHCVKMCENAQTNGDSFDAGQNQKFFCDEGMMDDKKRQANEMLKMFASEVAAEEFKQAEEVIEKKINARAKELVPGFWAKFSLGLSISIFSRIFFYVVIIIIWFVVFEQPVDHIWKTINSNRTEAPIDK